MLKHPLIISNFKEHHIAQKQGRTTSHANMKLFDKHKDEIKSKLKFYHIFKASRTH